MIVALAGHVDHGKTALIRALTGVETDRLAEEQRRGMTIDLGFAYLHQPGGPSIGFVDVPGHERFLANMLAGVMAIDSILLIVAADDGPMPQTVEHLAVLQLTGAAEINAVITKTDMVDPTRVDTVIAETRALLERAGYTEAAIYPVSSISGAGISVLRDVLLARSNASSPRVSGGNFRLAIDRRFTLQGIGLVVTGMVIAGRAAVGDSLLLSPPRLAARIRTIHVQDRPAEFAKAGDRCALAITGPRIEASRVRRGHWLIAPDLHAPTATLDVYLRIAEGQRLRHGRGTQLHLAAAHGPARALVLAGGDMESGGEGFVRLVLNQPIAALHGDRVALRDDGSGRIVAGGQVIDPFPSERRGARAQLLSRLAALRAADPRVALEQILAVDGSADVLRFARSRNVSPDGLTDGMPVRVLGDAGHRVAVASAAADAWRGRLLDALTAWHAAQPDNAGPGQIVLLRQVASGVDLTIAEAALADLLAEASIMRAGASLHLPCHTPRLSDADEAIWGRLAPRVREAGLRPPRVREWADELGLSLLNTEATLERLHRFGRLLRVAPNRYFLPETITLFIGLATELARAHDGFTASEFNKRTGIGRNLTIEVLEYLDWIGATVRVGEVRHPHQAAVNPPSTA
ncbi:MAG: selenocysteine-specific translation elongation factor [Acetobacteraceae bacterium]|nr:selenocysteine-specific translation elongation factor [Acetobacteraceae bacterium]